MSSDLVQRSSRSWSFLGLACWGLLASGICGCGSSDGALGTATTAKETKPKGDSTPKKSDGSKPAGSPNGPKSVGGIPYDVFFDKPLVIAANAQTGAASNTKVASADPKDGAAITPADDSAVGTTAAKEPPKNADASGGGAASLKDIIDKDSLANEVKNVRNYLAGKAASVATYNTSYLEIAPEAATLAVLAVAVQQYPEEFSWKSNAKYVRDLSASIVEMTSSEKAKNKNTFDAVAAAFEKIDDILKGSSPAGLPDSADSKDFGEAVGGELRHVMKRIQKAESFLKSNVSNEATLKKEADRVAQEGAVLQFLGHAITSPGFGWGDDEGFLKHAKPLREGGKQLIEAAKTGTYSAYDEAMGRISKTCTECHGEFKNN